MNTREMLDIVTCKDDAMARAFGEVTVGIGATRHLMGSVNDSGRRHQTAAPPPPSTGGLVVVRDERGVLSVMHCLPDDLVLDAGFQQAYRAECAALAALGEPRVAEPLSYIMDAGGHTVSHGASTGTHLR